MSPVAPIIATVFFVAILLLFLLPKATMVERPVSLTYVNK
jgi:hypothetical protein